MGCVRKPGLKESALLKPGKRKGRRGKDLQILKSQLLKASSSGEGSPPSLTTAKATMSLTVADVQQGHCERSKNNEAKEII